MTRFLPALANGAVVVAQSGGADVEQAAWADAVVFPQNDDAAGLAAAVAFYLANDTARDARARAALDLLRSRPYAAKLRRPLATLARDACPAWTPADVDAGPTPWQWDLRREGDPA